MALISKPYTFSDTPANTNIIDADECNANWDRLYELANGNLTSENLAPGAVGTGELAVLPAARVYETTAQSIPHATWTALTFGFERFDTASLHAAGSSQLIAPVEGVYQMSAHVTWSMGGVGVQERGLALRGNGSTFFASETRSSDLGGFQNFSVASQWRIEAGGYVEAMVYQASGLAALVNVNSAYSPEFAMAFMTRTS